MKTITQTFILGVALAISLLARVPRANAQPAPPTTQAALAAEEKAKCLKNLKMIHEAIQAYRKEHKDLPNWVSDLVPNFVADTSILMCPVMKRTGNDQPFKQLSDPKLTSPYIFQFSQAEMGGVAGGGKVKMRDWKRMQMAMIGGDVPMLTCVLHPPGQMHIGFNGRILESQGDWEGRFADVVNVNDLYEIPLKQARLLSAAEGNGPLAGNDGDSVRRQPETPATALVGKPAPNFKLKLLDGGEFELAAHKDKNILLLDFWATWCGPCRAAMPVLVGLAQEYKDKGVLYYAVDLREKPEKVREYLNGAGLKISVPMDTDGDVGRLYEVSGIPTLVIVGKEGSVQVVQVGFSPNLKERLKEQLDQLVAGKKLEVRERP